MAEKFGRLALHMWTIDTTPLATALDAAREAGYDAVELRRIDFKRCYEAGMTNAQVLDLALHGFIVGQPFRLRPLRQAIRHCVGHEGRDRVWYTRAGDIARHCFAMPKGIIP